MHESQLLPYSTSPLPPGPWLVFAPHSDDEVFGLGGSLLLARGAGIEVELVVLTDGAAEADDKSGLRDTREAESRCVGEKLGLAQIHFLREPDRGLRNTAPLRSRIAQRIEQSRPSSVFFPSRLDLHPDHRATAELVWQALAEVSGDRPATYQYETLYQTPCNQLIDVSTVIEAKHRLMQCYASQQAQRDYVSQVQHLDAARAFTLPDSCEAAEALFELAWQPGLSLQQAMRDWLDGYFRPAPDETARVSVIVRTNNRPQLLREALDSLVRQQHPNIELVLVNDGDAPVSALADSYRESFAALVERETSQPGGRAAAANLGLEQASGDYFMFLDDDDWLAPDHIAGLLEAHQAEHALVAYSGVQAIDHQTGETGRIFNQPYDRIALYSNNTIPIHAALVRREVIDQGYRFDEGLDCYEDWDFWLQLAQLTPAFTHVDAITAFYRIGGEHGFGVRGGGEAVRRRLIARWAKTWKLDDIEALLARAGGRQGEHSDPT